MPKAGVTYARSLSNLHLTPLHIHASVSLTFSHSNHSLAEDSSPCKGSPLRPGISAPQNTPTSAAAAPGSSSSTKKQRRSVAEAGQMAQVKQKVALFESFKGQSVDSSSSSTSSGGSPGSSTTTTNVSSSTSTSTTSSSSSSSSSYHAVFPDLNLGDTSTMTTARNFIMTIPRISEEAEDEMVALGEFSREEKEEEGKVGGAGGRRRMVDQGVGTTAARVLDMGNDVQASSSLSSYRQQQQQIQRGGGGGAPSATGLLTNSSSSLTSTQQITLALKELQLTSSSSGPSQQQDKQQEQLEQPKADVHEGGEEEGGEGIRAAVAGPAPIIECNHKPSPHGAHVHFQQQDTTDSSRSNSTVGGFLGMVQKTLGLGKHRGSIPPVHPSSSLVGTAAAAAAGGAMTASSVLEPLPPIKPEDTYLMSESDEEGRSGGGGGGGGGGEEGLSDSEEEEEMSRKRRAAKKVSCVVGIREAGGGFVEKTLTHLFLIGRRGGSK